MRKYCYEISKPNGRNIEDAVRQQNSEAIVKAKKLCKHLQQLSASSTDEQLDPEISELLNSVDATLLACRLSKGAKLQTRTEITEEKQKVEAKGKALKVVKPQPKSKSKGKAIASKAAELKAEIRRSGVGKKRARAADTNENDEAGGENESSSSTLKSPSRRSTRRRSNDDDMVQDADDEEEQIIDPFADDVMGSGNTSAAKKWQSPKRTSLRTSSAVKVRTKRRKLE